ncbi:hypothetical protein RA27_18290 [Ruegeria sp. ANG-R]|nr:hypothetical protein RA27_18290 [Ruegeria sp. ANG-R]
MIRSGRMGVTRSAETTWCGRPFDHVENWLEGDRFQRMWSKGDRAWLVREGSLRSGLARSTRSGNWTRRGQVPDLPSYTRSLVFTWGSTSTRTRLALREESARRNKTGV